MNKGRFYLHPLTFWQQRNQTELYLLTTNLPKLLISAFILTICIMVTRWRIGVSSKHVSVLLIYNLVKDTMYKNRQIKKYKLVAPLVAGFQTKCSGHPMHYTNWKFVCEDTILKSTFQYADFGHSPHWAVWDQRK